MAAVTVTVQFRDGSTRRGIKVECSSGNTDYTDSDGHVVFDNLSAGRTYRVSSKGESEEFTAGRKQKVVITVS